MDKDLKIGIGFIFFVMVAIGMIILISPLIFILSDWIIELDSNVLGIGIIIIGIVGIYLLSIDREKIKS